MHKDWLPLPMPDLVAQRALADVLGSSMVSSTLLLQRGIATYGAAHAFFCPDLAALHDPWGVLGMRRAVERIALALERQEGILLYGDYDVDGVTAVAMVCDVLRTLTPHVHCYIPDRKEGYGLSERGVAFAARRGAKLLVTLDCGTRAVAPIALARRLGIDVIVCDHHLPGALLPPAVAVLNPQQRGCRYPFKGLSGCGVGFKLLHALALVGIVPFYKLWKCLDLVALSIAADIVPMTGENRILAHHGLRRLGVMARPGVRALCEEVGRLPPFRICDLVFRLAPPLNAPGRVAHMCDSLALLLAGDADSARVLAKRLVQHNRARQQLDRGVTEQAMMRMQHARATTVLYDPRWHRGILGIAAARCIERYYRPTVLLTRDGTHATGSARSVAGCHLLEVLDSCKALLTRYGGHAYAAGLTLPMENIGAFSAAFERAVKRLPSPPALSPPQPFAMWLDLDWLTERLCNVIERMGPFGPGHRRPVFATGPVRVVHHRVCQGKHLQVCLATPTTGRTLWRGIGFGMAEHAPCLASGVPMAILYTVQRSTYRGTTAWQLLLKDLRPYADVQAVEGRMPAKGAPTAR